MCVISTPPLLTAPLWTNVCLSLTSYVCKCKLRTLWRLVKPSACSYFIPLTFSPSSSKLSRPSARGLRSVGHALSRQVLTYSITSCDMISLWQRKLTALQRSTITVDPAPHTHRKYSARKTTSFPHREKLQHNCKSLPWQTKVKGS
jgi:hypothetical protein